MKVLILGGTTEARELAAALHPLSEVLVISSLAGRTTSPSAVAGDVRIGGFGGSEGLADYLRHNAIDRVIDATHPFAAQITHNAAAACAAVEIPLLRLQRPQWEPEPADMWITVPDVAAAAAALIGDRILLTIGRQEVSQFAACPQHFLIRAIEPPQGPLPSRHEILLARGPFAVGDERRLMGDHAISALVTKNSGGDATAAKLIAARELSIPVVMVQRPDLPETITAVDSVVAAVGWISDAISREAR